MSEDSSSTIFKLTKKYLNDVEKCSKEYSDLLNGKQYTLELNRGKYRISVEHIDYSLDVIMEFHEKLASFGADDIVTEVFFEQVGESTFHKIFGNKLMSFESLEEVKEFQKEFDNKIDVGKFVFSRDRMDDYAFCRFKCPNKKKRDNIVSILVETKSIRDVNPVRKFKDLTDGHYKSRDGFDVEWCKWRITDWETGKTREHNGINKVVQNIEFIDEQGQFIFVAFDLSKIDFLQRDLNEIPYEDWREFESAIANTVRVLGSLDGVKHLMIKYRLSKYTRDEINLSEPYKTDEHRDATPDDFWEVTYDNM